MHLGSIFCGRGVYSFFFSFYLYLPRCLLQLFLGIRNIGKCVFIWFILFVSKYPEDISFLAMAIILALKRFQNKKIELNYYKLKK